jgi:hypothetical protein
MLGERSSDANHISSMGAAGVRFVTNCRKGWADILFRPGYRRTSGGKTAA